MDHMEFDSGVFVSALVGAAIAFVGWVIRIAARTTLEGLKESINLHAKALGSMQDEISAFRREMAEFRVEMATQRTRLEALEHE